MNKRKTGELAEQLSCSYLREKGCKILCTNFRNRYGEIDIIAKDGKYLCFIEVKYRSDISFGTPESAVDYHKQKQICKVSRFYLFSKSFPIDTPIRYDVIGVSGQEGAFSFHWIKGAFDYVQ